LARGSLDIVAGPDLADVDFDDCLERARQLLGAAEDQAALDEANQRVNQAIALRPTSACAWLVKCQVLSARGDDVAALAAAEMALRRAPHRAEAHYWRGAILGDLGRQRDALRSLERAFKEVTPDDLWLLEDLYYEKATVLESLGHRDAATATYEAGLASCPGSAILRQGLAPLRRAEVRSSLRVLRGGLD
jgi:tetratricopeptide (TPR) repeat protein